MTAVSTARKPKGWQGRIFERELKGTGMSNQMQSTLFATKTQISKLILFVPGEPAPGGSKKGFYNKNLKRVLMVPDCPRTKPWMNIVAAYARRAYPNKPLEGPIRVSYLFQFIRPEGHYGSGRNCRKLKPSARQHMTVKPDLTKIERSTEDALTGIIWKDDSQVVSCTKDKIYVDRYTGDPGVWITVEEITD